MKRKAKIVLGLGFGDEGKGLATDFLCASLNRPIVIRFNGGHQAGHTVVNSQGRSHVFSNFGAGTFRNVPTYWSSYCTFSPAHFLEEYDDLKIELLFLIDPRCPVTTHYDVLYNRALEDSRGSLRFGSCGVGFGATQDRQARQSLRLYVKDLLTPDVFNLKLKRIKKWYRLKLEKNTIFRFDAFDHESEDVEFNRRADRIREMTSRQILRFVSEREVFNGSYGLYLFEGAQGILLDQTFGTKPFITKSNTTSRNAIDMLRRNLNRSEVVADVVYVTRAYQTRHGNGPFRQCKSPVTLRNIDGETNHFNPYQGNFKISHLDLDLINYSLQCDSIFSTGLNKSLVLTCIDQVDPFDISVYSSKRRRSVSFDKIPKLMKCDFQRVHYSYSSCSDHLLN